MVAVVVAKGEEVSAVHVVLKINVVAANVKINKILINNYLIRW